jgi:hypothetical protein
MVANDRLSGTDADRHDDISRIGSSGFDGIADSVETGDLGGVISEGANIDVFAEACLLGFGFFTRNGRDWTGRFPLIARAALSLKAASCLQPSQQRRDAGQSRQ